MSIIHKSNPQPNLVCTSDASGSLGCGAYPTPTDSYFQVKWPAKWEGVSIAIKEMIPIVVAAAIWDPSWSRSAILFRCDNAAVVEVVNKRAGKDLQLAHLSRCLFFFAAYHGFSFSAEHIPGVDNILADALSRDHLDNFLSYHPQAIPSYVPTPLLSLLMDKPKAWTCSHWRSQFAATLAQASR